MAPDSAFIVRSSLIRRPSKPISPRMISRVTIAEVLAGASGSIVAEDDVRRHRRRHVR